MIKRSFRPARSLTLAIGLFLVSSLLGGCSTMKIENFAGSEPDFNLEEYFTGDTVGYGIVTDRFGKLRREFKVDINGYWDDDIFVLDEDFEFTDGEQSTRQWRIQPLGDNRYSATAGDIVGEARGISEGKALNWRYRIAIPLGGRAVEVTFDDWMFLQRDGVLINRAVMKKWGIKLGTVSIFFLRSP